MGGDCDGEDMHRQVEWMVPADLSILRFLYSSRTVMGHYSIQTPKTISLNTGYSRKHASARAQVLAEKGLVEKLDRGEYRLTDLGADVVDGEVEAGELAVVVGRAKLRHRDHFP